MPADYYIVVRRLASGGSVPVCAAERGQLCYGAGAAEIQMHNRLGADWLMQLAKERMPTFPGQLDFEIVGVDSERTRPGETGRF